VEVHPFGNRSSQNAAPQAPHRLTVALLIDLLGLELGLQLLHLRAVLPLAPASAAVQLDPTGELVAAFASWGQQVAQITPQQLERYVGAAPTSPGWEANR